MSIKNDQKKFIRKITGFLSGILLCFCTFAGSLLTEPCEAAAAEAGPQLSDVTVTDISASGYRVSASFTASAGIREVLMPTWTSRGGQDDLVWHRAEICQNTASFYVPVSDHRAESGEYITHIYVWDQQGRYALRGVNVQVPGPQQTPSAAPVITDAKITELTVSGYRVSLHFEAPAGVQEILLPTWTEKNGQDDLVWHKAQINGNSASAYIPISSHKKESGAYITHIYVTDRLGRQALKGLEATVPGSSASPLPAAPEITGLTADEITPQGCRITATFQAPAGIRDVLMPTWTVKNGQDDLVWHRAAVNGNTASFYVPVSAHKNESGTYITHVYVTDQNGKQALREIRTDIPAAPSGNPVITDASVTDITAAGYRVNIRFSAPAGVSQLLLPTWTSRGGQDDLIWHQAAIDGSTASFYVSAAAHRNESGEYITHIYLTDRNSRTAPVVGLTAVLPAAAPSRGHMICIDAGHQQAPIYDKEPNGPGSSVLKAKLTSGTAGCVTGLAEYQLNLLVSLSLKQELIRRGYQVVMIRETNNCPMSNAERAVYANNSGAELFVRIHANSSSNPAVSGAMFYAPSPANPYLSPALIGSSNYLSAVMVNSFCAATGAQNHGVLQDDTMTGINWCTIPVTIAEMGFMSNPAEDRLMASAAYQAKMVQGLANGIDAYFGK